MTKPLHILIGIMLCVASQVYAEQASEDFNNWPQAKGTHFVVFYSSKEDEAPAQEILRRAEEYYNSVTDLIGYARYKNFWTWDERVKILYFPDQSTYAATTGQPEWSKGFSLSHLDAYRLRMIVSFRGQENFLTGILPHEIGHLIVHDFIEGNPVPLWFDEGVAQMEEEHDHTANQKILAQVLTAGKGIPVPDLVNTDIRQEQDATQVSIFYAESLYIVEFLVKTYGKDAFRELCRGLRDGEDFEKALKGAYYPTIESLGMLEDKWTAQMRTFLQ